MSKILTFFIGTSRSFGKPTTSELFRILRDNKISGVDITKAPLVDKMLKIGYNDFEELLQAVYDLRNFFKTFGGKFFKDWRDGLFRRNTGHPSSLIFRGFLDYCNPGQIYSFFDRYVWAYR